MMEALDFEVVNDSTSCDQIWNNLSSMSRDENQSAQRQDHGLCPVCGQQLFLLKPTMRLGFLALCYGMGNQPSNRVQRIPLTIPQLVERGQCLKCRSRAALLTDSSSAAEEDLSHHESNPTSCPGISITQQQSSTTVLDDGCVAGTHDVGPGGRPVPTPSLEPCLASTNNTDTIHPPPLHPREDASGWHVSPHRPCLPERALSESALLLQQRQQSANPSLRNKWPNEFSFSSTRSLPAGTAIYHGEYNSRGEKHGEGEMTWCNGDVYRGTFVNDVREGYGVLVFASTEPTGIPTVMDGGEYVGNWRNNLMDGSGTRRYPNGDVYVGEYRAGKRQGRVDSTTPMVICTGANGITIRCTVRVGTTIPVDNDSRANSNMVGARGKASYSVWMDRWISSNT